MWFLWVLQTHDSCWLEHFLCRLSRKTLHEICPEIQLQGIHCPEISGNGPWAQNGEVWLFLLICIFYYPLIIPICGEINPGEVGVKASDWKYKKLGSLWGVKGEGAPVPGKPGSVSGMSWRVPTHPLVTMTCTQPFPTPCSVTSRWWSEIGQGGRNIYNSGNGKCLKSGFFIWIGITRISSGLHWRGSAPQTMDQAQSQATCCCVIGELPVAEIGFLLWSGHSYDYLQDWGENSQDLGHLLSLLQLMYHPHIMAPPRNLSCSRLLPEALPVSHQLPVALPVSLLLPDALPVSHQSLPASPGRSHRTDPPPHPSASSRAGVQSTSWSFPAPPGQPPLGLLTLPPKEANFVWALLLRQDTGSSPEVMAWPP